MEFGCHESAPLDSTKFGQVTNYQTRFLNERSRVVQISSMPMRKRGDPTKTGHCQDPHHFSGGIWVPVDRESRAAELFSG